jgi:hypothetical protein
MSNTTKQHGDPGWAAFADALRHSTPCLSFRPTPSVNFRTPFGESCASSPPRTDTAHFPEGLTSFLPRREEPHARLPQQRYRVPVPSMPPRPSGSRTGPGGVHGRFGPARPAPASEHRSDQRPRLHRPVVLPVLEVRAGAHRRFEARASQGRPPALGCPALSQGCLGRCAFPAGPSRCRPSPSRDDRHQHPPPGDRPVSSLARPSQRPPLRTGVEAASVNRLLPVPS